MPVFSFKTKISFLTNDFKTSAVTPAFFNSSERFTDIFFFDNTDADGMARVIASIPDLSRCLCVVISKSGGTKETRNGMLIAEESYKAAGLDFAKHACAVTGEKSELDNYAIKNNWLGRFPTGVALDVSPGDHPGRSFYAPARSRHSTIETTARSCESLEAAPRTNRARSIPETILTAGVTAACDP